jgi:tRNA(His) 5'-end guanylyltransferase
MTMKQDSLGDRMKRYENHYRHKVLPRSPVIIRVDGKAFHTVTKGCQKPFDKKFGGCMDWAAGKLLGEVQNSRMAFVQSDEISLLLVDFNTFQSQQWFDGNLQKMVSVSAAVASVHFSDAFERNVYFDSRAFVLPREEVANYFIWRQQDATRNSIQMLGHAHFSHKQLQGKNCDEIQEMLFQERGVNWNDLSPYWKRGRCFCTSNAAPLPLIDNAPPIFTADRSYVENFLEVEQS